MRRRRSIEIGHASLLAPERDRATNHDAVKLTTSVIANRARPAAISADRPKPGRLAVAQRDQARHRVAARLEDVEVDVEARRDDQQDGDRLAERPAETEHRAADDAAAAERQRRRRGSSPSGSSRARTRPRARRSAPARTPRASPTHWIGITIIATTTPAMNVDAVYTRGARQRAVRIGTVDVEERDPAEPGVDPARQAERSGPAGGTGPTGRRRRSAPPPSGRPARRATTAADVGRDLGDEQRGAHRDRRARSTTATSAMSTVKVSTAAMPNSPRSGSHIDVVRNEKPTLPSASRRLDREEEADGNHDREHHESARERTAGEDLLAPTESLGEGSRPLLLVRCPCRGRDG